MDIRIDAQLCKGCAFCVRYCPEQALAIGGQRNKKGDHYAVAGSCTADACGLACAVICPEGAITVKQQGEVAGV